MQFYFGHHKCASGYLHEILRLACARLDLRYDVVSSPEQFGPNLREFLGRKKLDFLSYINAQRKFIEQLDIPFRAVHVIRDPRDVVISAYYSHLHSHPLNGWPELAQFRDTLKTLSVKDGLLAELAFIDHLPTNGHNLQPLRNMMDWNYRDGRILELRFEQLVADPAAFFAQLGRHLGLTGNVVSILTSRMRNRLKPSPRQIRDQHLLALVERHSFRKFSGRPIGVEDQTHHYRKGVAGGWRNYFDEEIKNEFKKRFPGLLSRLGYENSENW